jgi:hypothetical protein
VTKLEVAVWHSPDVPPERQELATRLNLRLATVLREHDVKTS